MSREWKPGDVAMVPFDDHDERAIWTDDGWVATGYPRIGIRDYSDVRPLVVIDPEDREQVERLLSAYVAEGKGLGYGMPEHQNDDRRYAMQAALREFANPTPPKPEEPTGLGAVVEGITVKYVRIGNGPKPWMVLGGPPDSREDTYSWADLATVHVLSEGVQA